MQCPNGCPAAMREDRLEKIFHRNNEPIVISDLRVFVCAECGQESMPLKTARNVEDVLNGKKTSSGKFTAELFKVG